MLPTLAYQNKQQTMVSGYVIGVSGYAVLMSKIVS